ncbi:MAG: 30S ribosomal protein S15 [Chloroflexi bacterium]|nr:30S ribosomal protein S15 [Chloroflexota bacterium]
MPLAPDTKGTIIEKHRLHPSDTGSSDVQIAMLTRRILDMIEHLRAHSHDHASRRGLLMMVGRRRRLLNYLRRTEYERYRQLITSLGLRR